MAHILVVGSSNTDMIVRVPTLPAPGETVLGGTYQTAGGGKGANQAVAAARAGGRVTFIGAVGTDNLGDQAVAAFERDGIDTRLICRADEVPSGVALIFVDDRGENCIAVAPGANDRLTPDCLAEEAFSGCRVVLLQLEIPPKTVAAAADMAHHSGSTVILNPAPARALPDELLRCVSILTPNEHEAEMLSGVRITNEPSMREAAHILHARGIPTVILTLGARGAFLSAPDREELVPAFPARAVDTTAAGDVFNGALAAALARGEDISRAVRFASAAAALSVTRPGAQPSAPSLQEILERLSGEDPGL